MPTKDFKNLSDEVRYIHCYETRLAGSVEAPLEDDPKPCQLQKRGRVRLHKYSIITYEELLEMVHYLVILFCQR